MNANKFWRAVFYVPVKIAVFVILIRYRFGLYTEKDVVEAAAVAFQKGVEHERDRQRIARAKLDFNAWLRDED